MFPEQTAPKLYERTQTVAVERGSGLKDDKTNITDPDSRIMKTRNGFVHGFNAQPRKRKHLFGSN